VRPDRTEAEWHCLRVAARGQEPTHAEKVATIFSVQELKGYMLQLRKELRLDADARAAIDGRLSELEVFYGRKLR
jgi:hypothetical protein